MSLMCFPLTQRTLARDEFQQGRCATGCSSSCSSRLCSAPLHAVHTVSTRTPSQDSFKHVRCKQRFISYLDSKACGFQLTLTRTTLPEHLVQPLLLFAGSSFVFFPFGRQVFCPQLPPPEPHYQLWSRQPSLLEQHGMIGLHNEKALQLRDPAPIAHICIWYRIHKRRTRTSPYIYMWHGSFSSVTHGSQT